MCKLTVIIPCAGEGKRLGIPFSKELYSIEMGKCLIDYTFNLFSAYKKDDVHFVITITENKTDIIRYLSRYNRRFNISFTYFDPAEKDVPGSIKSTRHLLGKKNMVLLPDTLLTLKPECDIVESVCTELNTSPFIFLYKKENNKNIISTKGALHVRGERVFNYKDKPLADIHQFNAFWCSLAFTDSIFNNAFSVIEQFYGDNTPEFKNTSLYGARAIEVADYIDLGTWKDIYKQIQLTQC